MIVFVENNALVVSGYERQFKEVGEKVFRLSTNDFEYWAEVLLQEEAATIEAFLIGNTDNPDRVVSTARRISQAPLLALIEQRSLKSTIRLFHLGVDDVVTKPVHFDELILRIAAIKKRLLKQNKASDDESLKVFFDGRDPEYASQPVELPRRQRRILEYLVSINGRRATKAQIFSAVYGAFEEEIDENVIESHISKLRRTLREIIGEDPIDSKRYLGYSLNTNWIGLSDEENSHDELARVA